MRFPFAESDDPSNLPGSVRPKVKRLGFQQQDIIVNIIDHIRSIDWDKLGAGSGNASDVPDALLELLSPDQHIRHGAYWRLDNVIVVQADLYESSYSVIPVLMQMLEERVEFGRNEVYDLLIEIANGFALPTSVVSTEEATALPLMRACRAEIKKSHDVFLNDSKDLGWWPYRSDEL